MTAVQLVAILLARKLYAMDLKINTRGKTKSMKDSIDYIVLFLKSKSSTGTGSFQAMKANQ